jgi:hypothetical protein
MTDEVDQPPSASLGCVGAWTLVVFVSVAAIPVVSTRDGHGGEEWWTGLVLGSAALAVLGGLVASLRRRWRLAIGLIIGAALGLATVFGTFLVYFLGVQGS